MKYILGFCLGLATILIGIAIWQYLFCPQLDFTSPSKFSGNHWYNPYESSNPANWVKCNFHAHTRDWGGLTCGNGTPKDLWKTYSELNYRVHCISEYQEINKDFAKDSNYVPAYEHGYNFMKAHQLVVGDNSVTWADFLLPQTLSNKQWMLSHLNASPKNVVVLNHPEVRAAYSTNDMKYLSGYQCIEVLNPNARSFSIWDAALSSGRPAFITANDDLHHVLDRWDSGRFCTWLNLSCANKESVVSALKSGKGYGMEIGFIPGEDVGTRRQRIRNNLPLLEHCTILHDTLIVSFSRPASEIHFVGQGGKILQSNCGLINASYPIKNSDTYVRTEAIFSDSVKIYLNPIFRYKSHPFILKSNYVINKSNTTFTRFIGIMILMSWLLVILRLIFGREYLDRQSTDPLLTDEPEPVTVKW